MTSPALSPHDYITLLYRLILLREPDREGLGHWTRLLETSGDPTLVMAGLMQSDEYRLRVPQDFDNVARSTAQRASEALHRPMRIIDVGAQSMGSDVHVYSPLAAFAPLDVVGFDPLEERIVERQRAEAATHLTLHPYAIGDGGQHTLHINNDDATSSLYPLDHEANAPYPMLSQLHTVRTEEIATRRLDDVVDQPCDFLKIDVQGAELMVLRGAERTLARTGVVHCEVEFSAIYKGQPLYPDIQRFMNQRGFALVDLCNQCRYSAGESRSLDELIWADAVFFRTSDARDTLLAQALIAAAVYGKPSLAGRLLARCGEGA